MRVFRTSPGGSRGKPKRVVLIITGHDVCGACFTGPWEAKKKKKNCIAHRQPNDHAATRVELEWEFGRLHRTTTIHITGRGGLVFLAAQRAGSHREGCGGFVIHQMCKLTLA